MAVPVSGNGQSLLRRGMGTCLLDASVLYLDRALDCTNVCICHNSLAGTVKTCISLHAQIFSIEKKTESTF